MITAKVPVLAVLCLGAAVTAAPSVPLPGTFVEMPYEAFRSTVERPPDTVYRTPGTEPPIGLTLDNAVLAVRLADSTVSCTLSLDYTVLRRAGWAVRLLLSGNTCLLSDATCPSGDMLSTSDSGLVLIAAAGGRANRSLRCTWTVPAQGSAGERSARVAVPRAARGLARVWAPARFGDITVSGGSVLSERATGGQTMVTVSLPASGSPLTVGYSPPVRQVAADTAVAPGPAPKETRLSATQETAVFLAQEGSVALTALHLSVSGLPATAFVVRLPGSGYSLLSVEGNGIRRYEPSGDSLLRINLGFELEGDYALRLVGELRGGDSTASVPCFGVVGASRESARFALAVSGAAEAVYSAAEGCLATPLASFTGQLSPALSTLMVEQKKDIADALLAGNACRMPFVASVRLQRHAVASVADAIADSGSVVSVISSDWKMVTLATWWVRQSSRQSLDLGLPDCAVLWSVTVNGSEVRPLRGERGESRVSLQRFIAETAGRTMLEVCCTYYQDLGRLRRGRRVRLTAPAPDVPVGSLTWALYYPRQWHASAVAGDFVTTVSSGLGRRQLRLSAGEREARYDRVVAKQRAVQEQQPASATMSLPLMPQSPRHLLAHRILVVDEKPQLAVTFMAGWVALLLSALVVLLALAGVLALAWFTPARRLLRAGLRRLPARVL